jgi:hypothetical protein
MIGVRTAKRLRPPPIAPRGRVDLRGRVGIARLNSAAAAIRRTKAGKRRVVGQRGGKQSARNRQRDGFRRAAATTTAMSIASPNSRPTAIPRRSSRRIRRRRCRQTGVGRPSAALHDCPARAHAHTRAQELSADRGADRKRRRCGGRVPGVGVVVGGGGALRRRDELFGNGHANLFSVEKAQIVLVLLMFDQFLYWMTME